MSEIFKELILPVISFFGGTGVILLVVFLFPEKVEIWASKFWKIISFFLKRFEKKYIATDIQGHINNFNKEIKKKVKNYEPVKVKIQWIQKGNVNAFFKDNALLIRMKKSDNQTDNFVVATMTFISQVMLRKTKHYISPTQTESIDLYVAKKLFEKEKPEIVEQFIQSFLIPKTENSTKIANYFDKYSIIDRADLFFPLLMQELIFLGNKIFGQKKDSYIIADVNGLIDFLKKYSEREEGDDGLSNLFNGRYCRFGVMIIAKSFKVAYGDKSPYLKYLGKLLNAGIENIYIIGPSKEKTIKFIKEICMTAEKEYSLQRLVEREYSPSIRRRGKRIKIDSFMILLRKLDPPFHYDSEDQTT